MRATISISSKNSRAVSTAVNSTWQRQALSPLFSTKLGNSQRWPQVVYPPDQSPLDYGASHALRRAAGRQAHPTINLLQKAVQKVEGCL